MNSGNAAHIAQHVKQTRKILCVPDHIVQGRSEIIEPFMVTGVGAAQYRDLNSDLPVCILQVPSHIQTVTGLHSRVRQQCETCDLIHHISKV